MGISLREKIKQLPLHQQKKIEERSEQLIAEEKTRQQLRQLLKIIQELNGQFLFGGLNNVYPIKKYGEVGFTELAYLKFIDPQKIKTESDRDGFLTSVPEYCPSSY